MIQYTLFQKNPASHYIYIDLLIDQVTEGAMRLQLPAWRPGRYELGNFARNIKRVDAFDEQNRPLVYTKISKDLWEIRTAGAKQIKVTYSYYAAELNAGACYADTSQMYVNPVHCCMYVEGRTGEAHQVTLNIPADYKVVSSLKQSGNTLTATNYDELADSPFIASAGIQTDSYQVNGTTFYVHFNGECRPDFEKIKADFTAFTKQQLLFWNEFPYGEYHFLFQVTPFKFYHGVEHKKNTVIAIGPGYAINTGATYEDVLGVSCHELFHVWNIKTIRPAEMLPYDFTKENHARTGWVYEGFTTYYGDKLLLTSKVFTLEQYFATLQERLAKHFHNAGRYNLSVADSSWDTWLDGYVPGAPYRKTNIYDEGCLVAFMLDVQILRATGGARCLRDVCVLLYERFGLKETGYKEEHIVALVNEVAGQDLSDFFSQYVYTATDYEPMLAECFEYLGLGLEKRSSHHVHEHYFGFKLTEGASGRVALVYPYSPAWKTGLFAGDEVVAVNAMAVRGNLQHWLAYYLGEETITLTVISGEQVKTVQLGKDKKGTTYFFNPILKQLFSTPAFEAWHRF